MAEDQGDGRPIENPTEVSDMPEELEEAVRSDAGQQPVEGSESGDGLVIEEGMNEPGTKADS